MPVEISLDATVDLTFLLSSNVPEGSALVVMSMLMPEVGILELKTTLNEYIPDKAVAVVVPGSGSRENEIFSSTSTTGGGGVGGVGVGVDFLVHDMVKQTVIISKKVKDRLNMF